MTGYVVCGPTRSSSCTQYRQSRHALRLFNKCTSSTKSARVVEMWTSSLQQQDLSTCCTLSLLPRFRPWLIHKLRHEQQQGEGGSFVDDNSLWLPLISICWNRSWNVTTRMRPRCCSNISFQMPRASWRCSRMRLNHSFSNGLRATCWSKSIVANRWMEWRVFTFPMVLLFIGWTCNVSVRPSYAVRGSDPTVCKLTLQTDIIEGFVFESSFVYRHEPNLIVTSGFNGFFTTLGSLVCVHSVWHNESRLWNSLEARFVLFCMGIMGGIPIQVFLQIDLVSSRQWRKRQKRKIWLVTSL